jgi:2-polyprenyl-3-methyl-5-hydroxy-6-metoxy-1,4-benzoquinol methylase
MKAENRYGFEKYRERGAYHWRFTYPGNFRRSSPRVHALYDVPLDLVRSRLGRSLREGMGIDVGCGDGVLLYKALRQGGRVVGVDLEKTGLIEAAKKIRSRLRVDALLVNASCYDLPFRCGAFDYVISTEVIEHVASDREFLNEIVRILRPGGVFILTTPRELCEERGVRDPYHVREYTPGILCQLLSEFFHEIEILGIYPGWLDRVYKDTHSRLIELIARSTIKLVSVFWNPYRHILNRDFEGLSRCAGLVGVGRKATAKSDSVGGAVCAGVLSKNGSNSTSGPREA